MVFWGAFQLLLLALVAGGFPLWAHHPFPRESIALSELACGQVILVSLVGPSLFSEGWTLWVGMVMMIPIDTLAGVISNSPPAAIFLTLVIVGLWSTGLALVGWAFQAKHTQLIISSIATIWVVGGVMLDYVRWEANLAVGQIDKFSPVSFLPKLCAVGGPVSGLLWMQAVIPAATAVLLHLSRRLLRFQINRPSTSLHTMD